MVHHEPMFSLDINALPLPRVTLSPFGLPKLALNLLPCSHPNPTLWMQHTPSISLTNYHIYGTVMTALIGSFMQKLRVMGTPGETGIEKRAIAGVVGMGY